LTLISDPSFQDHTDKHTIPTRSKTDSFNNYITGAKALVASKRKRMEIESNKIYGKMRKVHQVEHRSKLALNNTAGKKNISPKSVKIPLQESSRKKSNLANVALLYISEKSLTENIATTTEKRSIEELNLKDNVTNPKTI
ncbi:hypothetical protein F8M41_020279, partial [Gigaspora margarita]